MKLDEEDTQQFLLNANKVAECIKNYYDTIENFQVFKKIEPTLLYNSLAQGPPQFGESFDNILTEFNELIVPNVLHWQHPMFMGYYPSNTSHASILGEFLTAALNVQCMMWQTAPIATELESVVMDWLKEALGLPKNYFGVIQDAASTALLVTVVSARERVSHFSVKEKGYYSLEKKLVAYCSAEAHASVEKGVMIAGIGLENLRKIPVNEHYEMDVELLEKQIRLDISSGFSPFFLVATLGTTGCCAVDPLENIALICQKYNIWLHVDAAYAGSIFLLQEYSHYLKGVEIADSFVFNPHKWLFSSLNCSCLFLRDKRLTKQALAIIPEYLRTSFDNEVDNLKDYSIQLGRKFFALKLWFVIKSFGIEGLKKILSQHLVFGKILSEKIKKNPKFELTSFSLNVICFRHFPKFLESKCLDEINAHNKNLLDNINNSGALFLSHTFLDKKMVLRIVPSQRLLTSDYIDKAWNVILTEAKKLDDETDNSSYNSV